MGARVAANLVIGSDGSTTLHGSSKALSPISDRQRFHQLRLEFGAILIGGNTARNEPYAKTPIPLIVLTNQPLSGAAALNPAAITWNMPLQDAIPKAISTYGDLLLESGPALLQEAITGGLLTELFLTISPMTGGENLISKDALLTGWDEVARDEVDGVLFLHYRLAPTPD